MEFLDDMKKAGHKVDQIAIVYENTDYGTSVAGTVARSRQGARLQRRRRTSPTAPTRPTSPPQVLQLKEKNPDAVIFISYTADSILYMKTMKNLDYMPKMIIGDDCGFSDPDLHPGGGRHRARG